MYNKLFMNKGREVVMATSSFDKDFILTDEASIKKFWLIDTDESYRKPIHVRPETEIERKKGEALLKRLLSH